MRVTSQILYFLSLSQGLDLEIAHNLRGLILTFQSLGRSRYSETTLSTLYHPRVLLLYASISCAFLGEMMLDPGRVYGGWSNLWRVVDFMAHGRVYGVWSGLWSVVEFRAGGRVQGGWSSLGRVVEFVARGWVSLRAKGSLDP